MSKTKGKPKVKVPVRTVRKKYLVFPGPVLSQVDGELHDISFLELCELYGVDPEECWDGTDTEAMAPLRVGELAPLIQLRPDSTGTYPSPVS